MGMRMIEADVKALAREYAPEAIATLRKIMLDGKTSASARISAATVLIDRGYGKARQEVEISGTFDYTRLSDDQLNQLEQLLMLGGADAGPAPPH